MRIALLGDVEMAFFASDIRRSGHEVFVPEGFAAWQTAVLDPASALRAFAPEAALLVLTKPRAEDAAAREALAAFCPRVIEPPLDVLSRETPGFYDARWSQTAGWPFSLAGLQAIEEEFFWALDAAPRKVLAVDADYTLWDGIISEDGPYAVRPRTGFQAGLYDLRAAGVLLVLLTKNDAPHDGLSAVERTFARPENVLGLSDFAYVGANWSPKPANLRIAAQVLNLAPEAFVFVDDNPHERAEMAARQPQVACIPIPHGDWPEVAQRQLLRRLKTYCFADAGLTAEDRARAARYADEAARRAAAAAAPSLDDYLASLDLRAAGSPACEEDLPRLAQMAGRTNQFNATTIRRDRTAFADLLANPTMRVWVFRAADRYGEMGLVAYVVADVTRGRITDFVMSCRAMGRSLEDFVYNFVHDALVREGVLLCGVDCTPTLKNAPFQAFHATLDAPVPRRTFFRACPQV